MQQDVGQKWKYWTFEMLFTLFSTTTKRYLGYSCLAEI